MNWFWPQFDTIDDAKKALYNGAGMAFFVAIMTGIITYLQLSGAIKIFEHWSASAYIDAALFAGIGLGLIKKSRIVAILAVLLYGGEQFYMMKMTGPRFNLVPIIVMLSFVNSVRGAFAYHDMKNEEQQNAAADAADGAAVSKKSGTLKVVLISIVVILILAAGFFFGKPLLLKQAKSMMPSDPFKLDGISMDKQPIAMIDGAILKVGDVHKGYSVKEIGADYVILERDGKQMRLELFSQQELYAPKPAASQNSSPPKAPVSAAPVVAPVQEAPEIQIPGSVFPAVPSGKEGAVPSLENLAVFTAEAQVMSKMRQVYSAAAAFVSTEEKDVSLQKLADRDMIPADMANGKAGSYTLSILSNGYDVEVYAQPDSSGSGLRSFMIDKAGNMHAEKGKSATEESPRLQGTIL